MATNPNRQESKNQVKRILEVLSRHSDVVSDALDGYTDLPERGYRAGVDALVEINVLMPLDAGQYQLNPRIRSFLSEQLAQFSAFQTLTRITEQILGAKAKWREIVAMKETGDIRDMYALESSLGYTVAEIVHFTSSNLLLLHTQISTEYGNVTSFKRKLAQNAFYAEGVKTLLAELNQLDALSAEIEREAIGRGLFTVRQLISSRIRSQLPTWMSRLNDVQASITKRLFDARRLENDLLYLSKTVLWLARNPTRNGIDIEPTLDVNPILLRQPPIRLRPQVEIGNTQLHAQAVMATAVARLTPTTSPWETVVEQLEPAYVRATDMEVLDEPLSPEDALIADLVAHLEEGETPEVSVLEWMRPERQSMGLDDGAWLLYVAAQLNLMGIACEFVMGEREPGDLNDVFVDVLAFAPALEGEEA